MSISQEAIYFVIILQLPVVSALVILNWNISGLLKIDSLKPLKFAWLLNLFYLCCSLAATKIGEQNQNYKALTLVGTVLNGASLIYFYLSSQANLFRKNRRLSILVFITISIIAVVARLSGELNILSDRPENDLIPYINMRRVPLALLYSFTFYKLYQNHEKILTKYRIASLGVGFFIYGVIQFIPILEDDRLSTSQIVTKTFIGYATGLIAKGLLIFGLIKVSIAVAKVSTRKEILANSLDDILGKTFHEVVRPLKEIAKALQALIPEERDTSLLSRAEQTKQISEIEKSYHGLIAIISASIKMYESDIGNKITSSLYDEMTEEKIEAININTLIQMAIFQVKTPANEKLNFNCDFGGKCIIVCNAYQLNIVFYNLLQNASEAIPSGNGKITIRTRVEKQMDDLKNLTRNVVVQITDTGHGVPAELLREIFNEGFSTKQASHFKRGYGLAIVRDLITRNKGTVEVQSSTNPANSGTTFTIKFPIHG